MLRFAMDTLPGRDSPHPRDSLMTFSNLPAKRASPGRVLGRSARRPANVRRAILTTPRNVGTKRVTRSKAKQQEVQTAEQPSPSPPRRRGRPATTIAAGMTKNTFVKKCKKLNRAIAELKKGMFASCGLYSLTLRIRCC
jgi:hypothetical protein